MNLFAKNKTITPLTHKAVLKINQFCPITFVGLRNIGISFESDKRIIKLNVK